VELTTKMARPGRNDPCPCGSGKKYKRCCLDKDEAAAAAARESARAAATSRYPMQAFGTVPLDDADELTSSSNAVVDLVHAGKLDEAERAAHELLKRFPEVHDGYDRLGMVYEARGNNKRAADYYRKVIAFVAEHPNDYDPEFADTFRNLVERLDPPAAS
jgi:tetratricopeptide (TPR) repeat protein